MGNHSATGLCGSLKSCRSCGPIRGTRRRWCSTLRPGICSRCIYDSLKTAAETIFVGKDRRYLRCFLQMWSQIPLSSYNSLIIQSPPKLFAIVEPGCVRVGILDSASRED
jgi:hypothetical protein